MIADRTAWAERGQIAVGWLLSRLVRLSARRPVITVVISAALAVAASLYAQHHLTFITSHLRLLPQDERYVVLLKEYQGDFGELNDIVIAVESPSPRRSRDYAARLVDVLRTGGSPALRITYRVDPAYFEGRGLLYLSADALTRLRDRLFDYQEFIESYAAHPTLVRLLEALNQQIANAMALGFLDLGLGGGQAEDLRFLSAVIDQVAVHLDGGMAYASPWTAAFSAGPFDEPDAGYFLSADRRLLFLFVRQERDAGTFAENRQRIATIRGAIARLRGEYPDVEAGVTGGPAISSDEMATAFADSQLATALAFAATLGLLLVAFRRVAKPLLMLGTLSVSLAWSTGVIAIVVGHLSIFSVMFISIVVGIGIDYGVYLLYRYEDERRAGGAPEAMLARAGERAGPGMLLGALTAAGAFFVLMATRFRGIAEFGFVSGVAILLALLAMLTLFPALLALVDRRRVDPAGPGVPSARPDDPEPKWLERIVRHRAIVLTAAGVVTALTIWGALNVRFGYNMLKLQAHGVESVAWEQRILARASRSGFAALSTAATPEELRRNVAAFAALPSVSKVESALLLVPDRQAEKRAIIQQFAPLVAPVRVVPATALDPASLRAPLETLRRRLRLASGEAGSDKGRREVQAVLAKVDGLLARLDRIDPQRAGPALEALQGEMARDFAGKLRTFQRNLDPKPVALGDLPPELRQRYIGASGRFMIRVHPAVDIWSREGAERFVGDLRRVDPDVTGPPIISFEAIRFIRTAYLEGTLYALVLVAAITGAYLGSVRGTVLALIPLGLGVLWTLGLMPVLGLEFNLANVWALPLIIGTAAEFGLNIFMRFLEGRRHGGSILGHSTVMAVVLNGLTTLAGFASLMVAHHRGIFGLGLLLTIGTVASLAGSLIVLPALLRRFAGPATPAALPARTDVAPGGAPAS